jgi:uncharacterized protein (DUF2062 family)
LRWRFVNIACGSTCGKSKGRLKIQKSTASADAKKSPLQKLLIDPLIGLLRKGATPKRLAWSLAVGFAIGINPLLGSTTILTLAVAPLFGLNIVASQIANHVAYPLQLLLFPAFIKLGTVLFHTAALPFSRDQLFAEARKHPVATTKFLWNWEWHALIVWAVIAIVLTPLIARLTRPLLATMLYKLGDEHNSVAAELVPEE